MSKPTDFYVYVHQKASDGTVFYVGKGRANRAWTAHGRKLHWQRTVAKHGLIVQVIAAGLNEECAFSIERMVIRKYGRPNLVNVTDGGEGTWGAVPTESQRKAVAEANARRQISDETRAKMRASRIGRSATEETRAKLRDLHLGKPKTDEHKEKLRRVNLGKTASSDARRKMSESRTGVKLSPFSQSHKDKISAARTDDTLHTLVHDEHGTLTALRSHFKEVYRMDTAAFSRVIMGKSLSHQGWRLPS